MPRSVEANLPQYQVPAKYRDGVTGVQLPPDLPFYVRGYRLQKEGDPERNGDRALWLPAGMVVEVDAFTAGVSTLMRYKEGTVTVFVKDADGTEEVGTWEPV